MDAAGAKWSSEKSPNLSSNPSDLWNGAFSQLDLASEEANQSDESSESQNQGRRLWNCRNR